MSRKKHPLIGTKPGGTSPAIAGSRIRVALIAQICEDLEPDSDWAGQIVGIYDHLTREQVQAAIDYWQDHKHEIEEEIRKDEEVYRQLQEAQAAQFRQTSV